MAFLETHSRCLFPFIKATPLGQLFLSDFHPKVYAGDYVSPFFSTRLSAEMTNATLEQKSENLQTYFSFLCPFQHLEQILHS